MATGKILQFDQVRGYGFIAADDGGEDVFLHASVFDGDPDELKSGISVEFKVMAGDRGRKAFAVDIVEDAPEPARPRGPVLAAPPAAVPVAPALPVTPEPDEEPMSDVLSAAEFRQEVTETLIEAAPDLTGQQISVVRQALLDLAKRHGWSDG